MGKMGMTADTDKYREFNDVNSVEDPILDSRPVGPRLQRSLAEKGPGEHANLATPTVLSNRMVSFDDDDEGFRDVELRGSAKAKFNQDGYWTQDNQDDAYAIAPRPTTPTKGPPERGIQKKPSRMAQAGRQQTWPPPRPEHYKKFGVPRGTSLDARFDDEETLPGRMPRQEILKHTVHLRKKKDEEERRKVGTALDAESPHLLGLVPHGVNEFPSSDEPSSNNSRDSNSPPGISTRSLRHVIDISIERNDDVNATLSALREHAQIVESPHDRAQRKQIWSNSQTSGDSVERRAGVLKMTAGSASRGHSSINSADQASRPVPQVTKNRSWEAQGIHHIGTHDAYTKSAAGPPKPKPPPQRVSWNKKKNQHLEEAEMRIRQEYPHLEAEQVTALAKMWTREKEKLGSFAA